MVFCVKLTLGWRSRTDTAARLHEGRYYAGKARFGGMNVSDAQRLKALDAENAKPKKLPTNSMLQINAMREVLGGKRGP